MSNSEDVSYASSEETSVEVGEQPARQFRWYGPVRVAIKQKFRWYGPVRVPEDDEPKVRVVS